MPSDAPVRAFTPEEQQAVRAEVRAVMQAEGLSQAAIARECGIPYGTWTSWFGGTYAGNNDKIASATQRWLEGRAAKQRTRALMPHAPDFQKTPTAELVFATLEHAQHMPDLVVVTGGAGVGKTSAIEAYRASAPNVLLITATPVLETSQQLLLELAEECNLSANGLSGARLSGLIVRHLKRAGGLVVVDEAQHLTSKMLDQLRSIHDQAGVGIALVGNEKIFSRLEGGARSADYAQLFSRVGKRTARPKPLKGDVEALLDAWGVEQVPARKMLHAIAGRPGALRVMTKVLRLAHMLAAAKDEPLDQSHVAAAWRDLTNAPAELVEAA